MAAAASIATILLVLISFFAGRWSFRIPPVRNSPRECEILPSLQADVLKVSARQAELARQQASTERLLGARTLLPPSSAPAADGPVVLIGTISSPANAARRALLREFSRRRGVRDAGVRAEFVFGDAYFGRTPPAAAQARVAEEARREGDVVFVGGREGLPHVGKAAEKSAAWWRTAPKRSSARFFCKTDDDSLIHHGHLRAALEAAEASAIDGQGRPTKNIIFSYIRWRGWLPNHRLQACGGGWGGPIDAIHHIEDPSTHCGDAEGPFPQGTGTLTCMSAPLARALADSNEFSEFLMVARARNDRGEPCATADECAGGFGDRADGTPRHGWDRHMWHHEDAGISYQMWRAATRLGLHAALVHLPERGWIQPWFHKESFATEPKATETSARTIVMHKVTAENYAEVAAAWRVGARAPPLKVDCSQQCRQWGWQYARKLCVDPPPLDADAAGPGGWRGFEARANGSLCKFDPSEFWRCCFLTTADGKDR